MMNPENLRPFQAGEDARTNGRRGGIKSGEARRRRRAYRQIAADLLALPVDDDTAATLAEYGVDPADADYATAVIVAMIQKATAGSVQAFAQLMTLTGEDPYLKVREAEVRLKRAELKERRRQFDLDREDRSAVYDVANDWAAIVEKAWHYDAGQDADKAAPDGEP